MLIGLSTRERANATNKVKISRFPIFDQQLLQHHALLACKTGCCTQNDIVFTLGLIELIDDIVLINI